MEGDRGEALVHIRSSAREVLTFLDTLLAGAMSSNPAMKDDDRTALEKAVGRRSAVGLSLEDQIARFPHLKHAPMATGMAGTNVNVTFKPLGTTIRNVRCMACGEWGKFSYLI